MEPEGGQKAPGADLRPRGRQPHFLCERARPVTFRQAGYSLAADGVLWRRITTGRSSPSRRE